MLLFAGSMDGQSGVSTQAGRDYTKLTGNNMYEVLTLIRFGRFDEVLRITERPTYDIAAGMWDFSMGYARLKEKDNTMAKNYLAKVLSMADTSKASFRGHSAKHLIGTVGGILEGEIKLVNGDTLDAISAFERAVILEDSLDYDEPEPLPFAARHWLGAALLSIDKFAEAETVYRAELLDHPNNGWSYFGLIQALEGQGKSDNELEAAFKESWARSDTWIRNSRF